VTRRMSGSGCRSLFGGYVGWEMGQAVDGSDLYTVEVAPASHLPVMKSIIPVMFAAKEGGLFYGWRASYCIISPN